MPQVLLEETHRNLTYQENKHDDFLLIEVEAILRHPNPAKITLSPPLFPKGGDVYLYKSGPHDRRVKDKYWWVNRGNNFHSKSQKRHAIMKTYFSLKDRNGSKKSDCLNGFRRHIYRLADAKDDRRTLMLVHYLGDEKLHTTIPHGNSKHKKSQNESNSHQVKTMLSNDLDTTTMTTSLQNLNAAKNELRTSDGVGSRGKIIKSPINNLKQPSFTIQTLKDNSSSDDLKICLEKLKHKSANHSELVENNLLTPTKIRRTDGNTYNIQGTLALAHHHPVNQSKTASQLWTGDNKQNHSQIHSVVPVSRTNTALLASVLPNKDKPQMRIQDERIKNQTIFHNRHQSNMSFQQRKKLQQLQKVDNSLASLLPRSLHAAESLSFKNLQSLGLNASPDGHLSKRCVNPSERQTSKNSCADTVKQSSLANCPETDSRLQIDYMKLFEEASKLPQMGCDVFVLVSYPGCKPAYWGTKKYVQKFENSECLQPYVASNCLSVKLKDSSLSPKNLNYSESETDNKLGKLRISNSANNNKSVVTLKKEPMEDDSPDNNNRIPEVTIKNEILEDVIIRDSTGLANGNRDLTETTRNSVNGSNNSRGQCLQKDNTFKNSLQRTIEEQYKSMYRTQENSMSFDQIIPQTSRKKDKRSIADEMTCHNKDTKNIGGNSNGMLPTPVYVKIESLADDLENR
ncbi:uncharacterized protein LOC106872210 [Octopus bimaculoides]|uniref:CG-1 domain-containing protein n=1 Tax=Octopus bimaculoides TaxID=37653 RepID=A0A0L8H879_OCTBM|nr:uncharacterized protein LOC106872210 [Octopus bimaculoides]XP_014774605.1 uncharacterized protein LOC106872210 [Octopus bimaculoides]|eukprot:XP_014774604.1 PREDICTED: uncharacterized protein LOC106872210 [Octopus bimaculoides]